VKTQKRCYIAGPMRSKPHFNFPAFYAAEGLLVAAGWKPTNPARMDMEAEGTPTNLTLEEQQRLAQDGAVFYATRDLKVILDLRAYQGDAIVVLPEWETSTGAKAEAAVGRWIGLPILTLEEATAALEQAA
jgi:hypothetical protein